MCPRCCAHVCVCLFPCVCLSAVLRSMAITTLQVVVYASLGAGIMHYVHTRGNEDGTRGNTSTKPQHVTTTRVSGSGPGSKRLAPV